MLPASFLGAEGKPQQQKSGFTWREGWLVWAAEFVALSSAENIHRECRWNWAIRSGVSLKGGIINNGFDVPAKCVS